MEKDEVFEIFSVLSKVIIFIPIVVVIIGLIYRFNQPQNVNPKTQNQNLNPKSNQAQDNNKSKITIDLKGPLVCNGKIDDLTVSAFIKDKKIKAVFDQKNIKNNILLNGDCYYYWLTGQYTGEKVCGLSAIVGLVETMINFGGFNLDLVTSQLLNFGIDQKIATNEAKITELIQNCQKKNIDDKVFELPNNILFKNKK